MKIIAVASVLMLSVFSGVGLAALGIDIHENGLCSSPLMAGALCLTGEPIASANHHISSIIRSFIVAFGFIVSLLAAFIVVWRSNAELKNIFPSASRRIRNFAIIESKKIILNKNLRL